MKKYLLLGITSLFFLFQVMMVSAKGGVLDTWLTWNSSTVRNPADTYFNLVEYLAQDSTDPKTYGYSFTDINGDGLTDFLYKGNSGYYAYASQSAYAQRYLVLINNGDMTYSTVYKCLVQNENQGLLRYYGNCAQ